MVTTRNTLVLDPTRFSLLNMEIYLNFLIHAIRCYLTPKEELALSLTCKTISQLFRPIYDKKLLQKLLESVVRGDLARVQELIEFRFKPELLLGKEKLIDYSAKKRKTLVK